MKGGSTLLLAIVVAALFTAPMLLTSLAAQTPNSSVAAPDAAALALEPMEEAPSIPDIDKKAVPSDALNIGPAMPAVVYGNMSFEVVFREELNGSITRACLMRVALNGTKLELQKLNVTAVKTGNNSIVVTIDSSKVPHGLYDLVVKTEGGQSLFVPRGVWVMGLEDLAGVFTFMHITDVHFGAGSPNITIGQYRRFAGYLFSQLGGVHAILNTGDEADTSSQSQYANSLAYRYDFAYTVPMFMAPGNHDYPNSNFIKVYGKTVRYAVIADRILIVAINTDGERGYADHKNLTLLESILANHSNIPIKIVMMHHPLFYWQGNVTANSECNCSLLDNPRENRNSILSYYWGANTTAARYLLRLVEDYNVTMVLAGHIHRDQYVEFHSNRTGTVTYFQTTTTLAHGTGTYQGFQVVALNLSSGKPSYPLAPPWFIGYEDHYRRDVWNAIPNTMPQYSENWKSEFDHNYYFGEIHKGKTALVLSLYNMMPTIDINRTVIISLPWPDAPVNLATLNAENASVSLVDYLYVEEMGRVFVALHFNMPPKSMVSFALYTAEDNEAPVIKLKSTIPRSPSINRLVKAYIEVKDEGWGVALARANASVDRGTLEVFTFEKYGSTTYLAKFKVSSQYKANLTIHIVAEDFAGNTNETTITISLSGPEPPANETTTPPEETTTSPPANETSPPETPTETPGNTTTTPPEEQPGETETPTETQTETESPTSTGTETGTTPEQPPEGKPTGEVKTGPSNNVIYGGLIILIIIIVAGIYLLRR